MVTWGEFATAAPGIAARGRELLYRSGRVRPVDDATRAALAANWDFSVGGASAFEFLVADALHGERASADDWPPSYTIWTSQGTSSD